MRYSYVAEFCVFADDSNAIDLTRAVPILVLVIVALEAVLITLFETQCKSTVCKLLIGNEP